VKTYLCSAVRTGEPLILPPGDNCVACGRPLSEHEQVELLAERRVALARVLVVELIEALADAIELSVDFHRPVTADNLRRLQAALRESLGG
jgi:hypothetical protein